MGKTTEAFRLIVQPWAKLQGGLFDEEPYYVTPTNREEQAMEVIMFTITDGRYRITQRAKTGIWRGTGCPMEKLRLTLSSSG